VKDYDYKIGDIVRFSRCYAKKASVRFHSYRSGVVKEPTPLRWPVMNEGWVVGIRAVVMSNYMWDWLGDDEGATATGTVEVCLLVTRSLRENPVIVRFADIETEDGK
jgi:hypothetical protein